MVQTTATEPDLLYSGGLVGNKTLPNTNNTAFKVKDLIDRRYRVKEIIDADSGNAEIYRVTDVNDGIVRMLKIYPESDALSLSSVEKASSVKSSPVAPVLAYGNVDGRIYTVMPFYVKGSLAAYIQQGVTFSAEEIREFILPSLIAGLKSIHDAGFFHKGLCPAVMMVADDESNIVLSGFDMAADRASCSPDIYTAPESFTGFYHKSSDYYSLGISLYELHTGRKPDFSGSSDDGRIAGAGVLFFPDGFDAELKNLVSGLTFRNPGLGNDVDTPHKRWEYAEVMNWLRGIPQSLPQYQTEKTGRPLIFAGKSFTSENDYIEELLKSWEEGKKELWSGNPAREFASWNNQPASLLCRHAELLYKDNPGDADVIFFTTMYSIAEHLKKLYWKGLVFDGVTELAASVREAIIQNARKSDEIRLAALFSGITGNISDYYFLHQSAEDRIKWQIQRQSIATYLRNNHVSSDIEVAALLVKNVQPKGGFRIEGRYFESTADFCYYMRTMYHHDITSYHDFCVRHTGDLRRLVAMLPQAVADLLMHHVPVVLGDREREARSLVFCGDYVFNDFDEALRYCRELLSRSSDELKNNPEKETIERIVTRRNDFFKDFYSKYWTQILAIEAFRKETADIERITGLTLMLIKGKLSVGECIIFGQYRKTSATEPEPVEWLIIDADKENSRYLLISRYGLEVAVYDEKTEKWRESYLRKWLNSSFLETVFSENIRKYIAPVTIDNEFDTSTEDRIFILSSREVSRYFPDMDSRRCSATLYAGTHGAFQVGGCSPWWTRSRGYSYSSVICIAPDGAFLSSGVYLEDRIVRPALWLEMNKS